jgi:glycosyltransferase involved in cell wall biosynthesis
LILNGAALLLDDAVTVRQQTREVNLLDNITPLILTFNEAPNIRRTLEKLAWAKRILMLDSFSTDETLEIVKSYPQVRVVQRQFDTFAGQCNFGLQQIPSTWVLSLDADYVLSDELNRELADLNPTPEVAGYRAAFSYCIHGRPLRASLYPPRTVLYRKDRAHYRDEGHGHRVQIDGPVMPLRGVIHHDDRKPLERWLNAQLRYSASEATHLMQTPVAELNLADQIRRRIIPGPMFVFFHMLFTKGLIFDGWAGWLYVTQRTLAEFLLALRLLEAKVAGKSVVDRSAEKAIENAEPQKAG